MAKTVELLLDLSSVTGLARSVLSTNVQKNLFKLGYHWSGEAPQNQEVKHTSYRTLRIMSPLAKSVMNIQYDSAEDTIIPNGVVVCDGVTAVYDVCTAYDQFLSDAKTMLVHDEIIDGVKVKITPTTIDVNPTETIAAVTEKAKARQKELFGQV
jgi:hypothetical protein